MCNPLGHELQVHGSNDLLLPPDCDILEAMSAELQTGHLGSV